MQSLRIAVASAMVIFVLSSAANGQIVTKVLNNGPDSARLVLAVVGDGYAAGDQATFRSDVENFVLKGALQHAGYAADRKAFNVYRVDAVSKESGISTQSSSRDTALKTKYTGSGCYVEESLDTVPRLTAALSTLPKYDYVVVLMNIAEYGGCAVDNARLYVTRAVGSSVAAHELAHGVARLFDEYSDSDVAFAGEVNELNCSTVLDAHAVSWNSLMPPGVVLPSDGTGAAVGMYRGCNYHVHGIFRPAETCMMRDLTQPFCPVCARLLRSELTRYLGQPAPPQVTGVVQGGYLEVLVRVSKDGQFQVLDAKDRVGQAETATTVGGDFVVAIQKDGVPVSVRSVSNSVFQRRGYGPPGTQQTPHSTVAAESATVRLAIPGVTLAGLSEARLDMSMYQVPGRTWADIPQGRMLPTTLQQLKASPGVRLQWVVPEVNLREALAVYRNRQ